MIWEHFWVVFGRFHLRFFHAVARFRLQDCLCAVHSTGFDQINTAELETGTILKQLYCLTGIKANVEAKYFKARTYAELNEKIMNRVRGQRARIGEVCCNDTAKMLTQNSEVIDVCVEEMGVRR